MRTMIATAMLVVDGGEEARHQLGRSSVVADFDGDGQDDLVVSAPGSSSWDQWLPGRVLVFFGPISGHLSAADADLSFAGEAPGDLAGWAVGAGDLTGDGRADLVVGAPFHDQGAIDATGKVYLLAGPLR